MKRSVKKTLLLITSAVCLCCLTLAGSGCEKNYSPNRLEYWFEDYSASFVKYDENANNFYRAGNYWKMTVKNDCNITISIDVNTDDDSTVYFYVNGKPVKSDGTDIIYNYVYKDLSLKKGDKLEFHALWLNTIFMSDLSFRLDRFNINDGTGGDYIIENI